MSSEYHTTEIRVQCPGVQAVHSASAWWLRCIRGVGGCESKPMVITTRCCAFALGAGIYAFGASCGAAADALPADGYVAYSGTATARHSARVLYREQDVVRYVGGRPAERVVLYTCANGVAFARKEVHYVDPLAPDFMLEDVANGMREGIRAGAAGRTVFFATRGEPEKHGPLPQVAGLVADAGFDEYVHAHWDDLVNNRTLVLHFLLPSRLDDYAFQVRRLRADRIDGVPVQVFRLRLAGIWGWILPGIDVSYGDADRVLMRYDGLSDLRDASNDNFQTIVIFPPAERAPADRGAADAAAMQKVRQARLAPCP